MNSKPTARRGRFGLAALLSGAALVTAGLAGMAPAVAETGSVRSTEPAFWTWDSGNAVGSSQLVRSTNGVTAIFRTTGMPANQAITLWFIIFNNPSACLDTPCSLIDLLFNADAGGDFHYGGGLVTGASGHATFAGHLAVGDTSGSGKEEIGMGPAIALTEPYQAEVLLALHTHGPKQTGLALRSQLSSFLGGCAVFLGDAFGWAEGPHDIPDAMGECTTFQYSRH